MTVDPLPYGYVPSTQQQHLPPYPFRQPTLPLMPNRTHDIALEPFYGSADTRNLTFRPDSQTYSRSTQWLVLGGSPFTVLIFHDYSPTYIPRLRQPVKALRSSVQLCWEINQDIQKTAFTNTRCLMDPETRISDVSSAFHLPIRLSQTVLYLCNLRICTLVTKYQASGSSTQAINHLTSAELSAFPPL